MFKNILIPISSEFYSREVLKRSVFLAEKFDSKIMLCYIIEEKVLNQTDKLSNAYRTQHELAETKNEIIKKQRLAADNIVFDDAKYYFKKLETPFEEKIIEGEFSDVVKNEISKNDYDLILMGFEKECMLNYRLLEEVNIPVWVVTENEGKSILAVCTNLAPNQKVPEISLKLTEALGWDLHMLYIVDTKDCVQVDEHLIRSDKKPEKDLVFSGQHFVQEMNNKGIDVQLVKGSFEKETIRIADTINPKLIIIGREQKKKGLLGIPLKNIKRKMLEKCKYSILFVN